MSLFEADDVENRRDAAHPRYMQWNRALARHFFREPHAGEVVRLMVDPSVLLEAMEEEFPNEAPTDEAEAKQDFVDAVQLELIARRNHWKPRTNCVAGTYPDFIGLLSVQVLTVLDLGEECRESGGNSRSYWDHLKSLLLKARVSPGLPFYDEHQFLWRGGLESWANQLMAGRWGLVSLPPDGRGRYGPRHLRLPYSQALLRSSDVEDFADVFSQLGLEPGQEFPEAYLKKPGVVTSLGVRLSRHTRRVFGDDLRRSFAVQQVREAFSKWDGTTQSLARPRSFSRPRSCELGVSLAELGPTAISFRLESSDSLESHRLDRDDIESLLGEEVSRVTKGNLRFRPRRRDCLLAVRDETRKTCVTRGKVAAGDRALLICRAGDADAWDRAADEAGVESLTWFQADACRDRRGQSLQYLPTGWCLGRFSLGKHSGSAVPEPWNRVVDQERARLRLIGGVRLRRGTWLTGAGPTVEVVGNPCPKRLLVDSSAHCPVIDGVAGPAALNDAGKHIVTAPSDQPEASPVRFLVRDAEVEPGRLPSGGGWEFREGVWPTFVAGLDRELHQEPRLVGMHLMGDPLPIPQPQEAAPPPSRRLVELLVDQRASAQPSDVALHPVVAAVASTRLSELSP